MIGKISKISFDVIDVRFSGSQIPSIGNILQVGKANFLFVESILLNNIARTIILKQNEFFRIGDKVKFASQSLMVPVGSKTLGHIINILGESLDGKTFLPNQKFQEVKTMRPNEKGFLEKTEILKTGIKVIDFFTPIMKGDKIGLFGGAGVGKTLITKELINNIIKVSEPQKFATILVGIGERSREGEELYRELQEKNILKDVVLFYAQMNESAATRMKIIYPAITSAEYFRDQEKKDVLTFIDNIYRFSQAGSEIASALGKVPSESGYQSTLHTEIANVQERLSNSQNGSITSFQTVFVPADDMTDPATTAVFSHLDISLVLDRKIADENRYPAVNILNSTSSNIQREVIGDNHFAAVINVKKYLQRYDQLKDLISILGENSLSNEDRIIVLRSRILENFFTQNFFMASTYSNKTGVWIKLDMTIAVVERILAGELDSIPPEKFLYTTGSEFLVKK